MSLISYSQFKDDFIKLTKLGHGNCASVHKIQNIHTKEFFALKIWKSPRLSEYGPICSEIEIITKLDDEAIPKIYHYYFRQINEEVGKDKRALLEVGIIMELCDRTLEEEVETISKDNRKSYTPKRAWAFMMELIRLFAKMQRLGFSHRDVKSANIMIKSEGPINKYKVIDFGYSLKNTPYASQSITGTAEYASPKIKRKFDNPNIIIPGGLNVKDDVYSLGKTILEVIRGKNCVNQKINSSLFNGRLRQFDANISFLLSKMLQYQEENRWDFIQVEEQMIKIEYLKASKNIVIDHEDAFSNDHHKPIESYFQFSQQSNPPSQSLSSPFRKIKEQKTIHTQTESLQIQATSFFGGKNIDHHLNFVETQYVENDNRLHTSVVSKVFLSQCTFEAEIQTVKAFEDFILVGMRNHIGVIPIKNKNNSIYMLRPKFFDGKTRQAVFHSIEIFGTHVVFIANFQYFFSCQVDNLTKQINFMLQNHQKMEEDRAIKRCYKKIYPEVTNEPKLYEGKLNCLANEKSIGKISCMNIINQTFLGFQHAVIFGHQDGSIYIFNQDLVIYKGNDEIVDLIAFDENKILFSTADGWMKMIVYPSKTYQESTKPKVYTLNVGQQILKFKIVNLVQKESDSSISWEDQVFTQVYLKNGEKIYLDHELLKLVSVTLKKKVVFRSVCQLPWKWSLIKQAQKITEEFLAERKISKTSSNTLKMETYLICDDGKVLAQNTRDLVVDFKLGEPIVFDASNNILAVADQQGNVKLLYTERLFEKVDQPMVNWQKKELSKAEKRVSQHFEKIMKKIRESSRSETQGQKSAADVTIPKTFSQFLKLQGKTIAYGIRRGDKQRL